MRFPLPEIGDFVWCRFPYQGMHQPGPKPRPVLVIDIGELRGEPAVEVVYGTSQKVERLFPGEFAITPDDGSAFVESGLSYATKFDTGRSLFLPFDDFWFAVPPGAPFGPSPKIGLLHPSLVRRVQAASAEAKRAGR